MAYGIFQIPVKFFASQELPIENITGLQFFLSSRATFRSIVWETYLASAGECVVVAAVTSHVDGVTVLINPASHQTRCFGKSFNSLFVIAQNFDVAIESLRAAIGLVIKRCRIESVSSPMTLHRQAEVSGESTRATPLPCNKFEVETNHSPFTSPCTDNAISLNPLLGDSLFDDMRCNGLPSTESESRISATRILLLIPIVETWSLNGKLFELLKHILQIIRGYCSSSGARLHASEVCILCKCARELEDLSSRILNGALRRVIVFVEVSFTSRLMTDCTNCMTGLSEESRPSS